MQYLYHSESDTLWQEEDDVVIDDAEVEVLTMEEFINHHLVFRVSQSKIKLWRRCHLAYHYKYNMTLQKRLKSLPLFLGILVHEAIEDWLKGKNYKNVFRKQSKEIKKLMEGERVDYVEQLALGKVMVEGYIALYDDDGMSPVEVELHVEVPMVDNIVFVGKVDSTQREDDNGRLWQMEHKTAAKIPDEKNRMADIQTLLYDWAMPIAGYEKPSGVIWDYLRKKIPTVPKLLASGDELSRAKNIDTTPEVYRKAIADNGFDEDDYEDILKELDSRENSFYRRIKLPVAKKAVAQVVEDFKSTAIQIKLLGHIVKDRNMTKDCSWCDYYQICQSDLRGGDTDFLIKKEFTTKEQRDGKSKSKKGKGKKAKSKSKKG